jgi:hypothetical protein
MNQRYVAKRELSEVTIDMRGEKSREVVKILSAPGGRRRIKQEYRRSAQTEPYSLARERDMFRDLVTNQVRSFSAPSFETLPLITPCENLGAGAAWGPWSGDLEMLPLGGMLWLVPVRVNEFITLSDYIDRFALEFEDLGRETFNDHDCFRWRFRHQDTTMQNGGDPTVDLWLSSRYPGVVMRFRITTEFQTPQGLFFAGRDIQVESLMEIGDDLALPSKAVHYAFETQSEDTTDSLKVISTSEILSFTTDVYEHTEFADPLLGFKFPKHLQVRVRDADLSEEFVAAKETIIFGDSEADIILRTTEDLNWIRNWCRENGFPVSQGQNPDAETHSALDRSLPIPGDSSSPNQPRPRIESKAAIMIACITIGVAAAAYLLHRLMKGRP